MIPGIICPYAQVIGKEYINIKCQRGSVTTHRHFLSESQRKKHIDKHCNKDYHSCDKCRELEAAW